MLPTAVERNRQNGQSFSEWRHLAELLDSLSVAECDVFGITV
jgi:hypothetical protein